MSDPQQALLDARSEAEVLDLLGPSWSAMGADARARYGGDAFRATLEAETTAMLDRAERRLLHLEVRSQRGGGRRYRLGRDGETPK